jgi:alpha-glucoside transport system substrate-binding protein
MRGLQRVLAACAILLFVIALPAVAGGKKEGQQQGMQGTSPTENPWTNGQDLSGETVNIFGAFVDNDAQFFNQSIEKFEEQTGIDIVYEGSGDFESLVTVRAEGGDPPNIAAFPQPGLLQDLVDRGFIEDIGGWFEEGYLQEQYDQSWLDMATINGQMSGVWYRASVKSLVWYPHPEFGDEGYEVPETWDELIALSDQMVEDGKTPWSIGMESSGATGWVATDWMEDIMLRTATPEQYDQWVNGELAFNSQPVRRAANLMAEIWFNEDYVLGGRQSILTVPFGDAANPLTRNPPQAWLHRQASFITGFFPEGIELGEDMRYFYFPPIDEEEGNPALIAGDIFSAMQDTPATRAVMRFLSQGISTREWVESGTMVSPHNDAQLSWYPNEWSRGYAEIIQNASTVRFDGSDLMPSQVGAGSFWDGMVNWVNGDPLRQVLSNIDDTYPEE